MSRGEKFWVGAFALIVFGAASAFGYSRGYAEGSLDTVARWSTITDRCIAKLESTLVIARNR